MLLLKNKKIFFLALLFFLAIPLAMADAAGIIPSRIVPCGSGSDSGNACTICHLIIGIKNVVSFGQGLLVTVAAVGIFISGIMYVISSGNEQAMTKAKGFLSASLIGFTIVTASWFIVNFVMWTLSFNPSLSIKPGANWYTFDCSTQSSTAGEPVSTISTPADAVVSANNAPASLSPALPAAPASPVLFPSRIAAPIPISSGSGTDSTRTNSAGSPVRRLSSFGGTVSTRISPNSVYRAWPWNRTPDSSSPSNPDPAPESVEVESDKYFGYAFNAVDGIGSGNYISEARGYSNIAVIGSSNNGDGDAEKIRQARDNCQKSILVVWPTFFNPADLSLYPDYQERWRRYTDAIASYSNDIIAFYILDEPYKHARNYGLSVAEMKPRLEAVAATIKVRFPQAKIAGVFGYDELTQPIFQPGSPAMEPSDSAFEFPSNYDWVGLDFYFTNYYGLRLDAGRRGAISVGDLDMEFEQFKSFYNHFHDILKSKMLSHQRLILVPDAYFHNHYPVNEEDILGVPQFYFDKAAVEPKTILIVPFLYSNVGGEVDPLTGLESLPRLREIYNTYGADIVGSCNITS